MAVTKLLFESTPSLIAELAFYGQTSEGWKTYSRFKSVADIERFVESTPEYRDLTQFVKRVEPGRVLDVGVAYGITSAYLAIKGFDVVALEPSLRLCGEMDSFFRRMNLQVEVANGTGEAMGALKGSFDAVVFYSSLHHCHDIYAVLANARRMLRPRGAVFISAPVLGFYQTEEWCYQMLRQTPRQKGHFSVNETIYRFSDYMAALTAVGFNNVTPVPSLNYSYAPKQAPWDTNVRFMFKRLFYLSLRMGLLRARFIVERLMQLSMLNTVLFARK